MSQQEQFLSVVQCAEAHRRFRAAIRLGPLAAEEVHLSDALGRVLAEDVLAEVDVPSFDRSNLDGFAVQAADCSGAAEEEPRKLRLLPVAAPTGVVPTAEVAPGTAMSIATGGMLPRGADAVVMVEHTNLENDTVLVYRAVAPGQGVSFAGTDIGRGETVLRQGDLLTSRETGVLAALGKAQVKVVRRPLVAILSTGDEMIPPGEPMRPPLVYDSNQRIVADAVRELGGRPWELGILPDDFDELASALHSALQTADAVILSGGTSKGGGDLSYRAVGKLHDPGIVAHGVALKPGKPICLAGSQGKPVVILPGFPTSAIFTFHEFVAPVLRMLAGRREQQQQKVSAKLPVKVNSEIGRTEYLLVGLATSADTDQEASHLIAYPMGKGSGSVTAFSRADGFVAIDREVEILEAGSEVSVQLLGRDLAVADLIVIGSHCVGLDLLLGKMQQQGFRCKVLAVGSTAGLQAAQRGECDIAGIHLLDAATGAYNRPFITDDLQFVPGYRRMQGIVYRRQDERFSALGGQQQQNHRSILLAAADCRMVNRNAGSGTRILIDRLLQGAQPAGYAVQAKSHNAVAAAVAQGRADWGVAIASVARQAGLAFAPLQAEQYDFVVPRSRANRAAVQAFRELLQQTAVRDELAALELEVD